MKCPRCKKDPGFRSEMYEGVEIDRCPTCKGVWLDEGEFVKILQTKGEKFSPALIEEAVKSAFSGVPISEQQSVELCPKCNSGMQALNYGYNSGVVIDRCFNAHGFWLDHRELEKLQAYKEHWDQELDENRQDWINLVRSVEGSHQKQKDDQHKGEMRPTKYLVNSLIRKLLG